MLRDYDKKPHIIITVRLEVYVLHRIPWRAAPVTEQRLGALWIWAGLTIFSLNLSYMYNSQYRTPGHCVWGGRGGVGVCVCV